MRLAMSVASVLSAAVLVSSCQRTTGPGAGCVAVLGQFDPAAPGFIVEYKAGTDPVATTAELGAKYSFVARFVYTAPPGFGGQLSPAAVEGVRCEPAVKIIEHDRIASIAGR